MAIWSRQHGFTACWLSWHRVFLGAAHCCRTTRARRYVLGTLEALWQWGLTVLALDDFCLAAETSHARVRTSCGGQDRVLTGSRRLGKSPPKGRG